MSSKPTILAVDDTTESLALLVGLLSAANYRVLPADSGELALAAVDASAPDLILLDVRMAGMDGLEVCRRLKARQETRHIPIILVSAFADVSDWVEGLQLGAADYLTKPFRPEELLTRVSTHLALAQAQAALERQAGELTLTTEQLRNEVVVRRRIEGELRESLALADRSREAMLSTMEDLKRAEEALLKKHDELEHFTYALSHDLRSPFVTVKSFLGYLTEDIRTANAARIQDDLGYIGAATDKVLGLLDRIRDLSQIGNTSCPATEASLEGIARDALALVAGQIELRGVVVTVTDEPIMVYGDRPRLVGVFQNLLDNAAKFMGNQPDPRVTIGVEETDGEIVVFVRDNGLGFDPKHRHTLFAAFERLEPGVEGSGLGLAIVERIVDLHGGRVWAESDGPGSGATFRLVLPGTRRGGVGGARHDGGPA